MYSPSPVVQEVYPEPRGEWWSPDVNVEVVKKKSGRELRLTNFNIIRNDIHKAKLDWVQMGVGPEGTGKTWVGIRDCVEIDAKFLRQSKDLPQVPFSFKEIKYFLEEWRSNNFYQRRGVALLPDEGQALLSSRNALSKESKELVTILTQIRAEYGFFVHINYQSQRLADSWLRNDRAKSIARTYFTFDPVNQVHVVGNVWYYNKQLMNRITKDGKTGAIVWPVHPSYRDTFEPGQKEHLEIYNLINEKKYAHYTSAETEKKAKSVREQRKLYLNSRLTVAKLDENAEEVEKIRKQLKEEGYE